MELYYYRQAAKKNPSITGLLVVAYEGNNGTNIYVYNPQSEGGRRKRKKKEAK